MNHDMDDLLRTWGERARTEARPAEVPLARLRGRVVSPVIVVAVTVVAMLAIVAGVLAIRSTSGSKHSATPAAPSLSKSDPSEPGPTNYDVLVVHDGDTVRVSAKVLALPGQPVRACAPLPTTDFEYDFQDCPDGLDATGVDLDNLAFRHTRDGAVEGLAELTGTYRDGTVAVTEQSTTPRSSDDTFRDPPCPAPAGGWPTGGRDVNLDDLPVQTYRHAHPGTIVDLGFARPSSTQVLLVVIAKTEPAEIQAALRPAYGDQLCVIQATVTHDQVQAALDLFDPRTRLGTDTGVYGWGEGIGADWQLTARLELIRVTPEAARIADAQPSGVVEFEPWLTRVQN